MTTVPPAVVEQFSQGGRLETPRAAGIAGLAFTVLFVLSIVLLRARPAAGSSAQEIADFYLERDSGRIALVGLYLAPFAGIAFLWFIAVVRTTIGALSRSLAFAFLYVFAVRAAAVFVLVVSTIALRTGVLPRWLVIAGYVIGLVSLFTVTYVELLVLLFPAWVSAVSIVILARARRG